MTPHIPRIRPSVLDALLRSIENAGGVIFGVLYSAIVVIVLLALIARLP